MITIAYSDPNRWPVVVAGKDCKPELATPDVRSVTISGDELSVVCMEFTGIPLPKYIMDWLDRPGGVTWWWTDAVFIVANFHEALQINKAHGK
jgi:diadenosine tetraphosphatase ApaH/serine/threonine PP2A family protein phosphatase